MANADDQDFQDVMKTKVKNNLRRQYLITYSQADLEKFPTRESFGKAVAAVFNNGTEKSGVDYWACCIEPHAESGQHYHMSVKLNGPRRWNPIRVALRETYGVNVNFSETHQYYYSAYQYLLKTDQNVYHSNNHPDLKAIGSPKTKHCMKAYQQKRKQNNKTTQDVSESGKTAATKVRRLSNLEVSEYIVANDIKTDTELYAKANEQKEAGKKGLAHFVLSRSPKALRDLIETTHKMQAAQGQLYRRSMPRMDVIRKKAQEECTKGCGGTWLQCATEVLRNNRVHPIVFAESMRTLLTKGRGKFRNIMIVGPANCAKTFLLTPLTKLFNTFSNPSNDKYAWLGAEEAQLIFLNDFRWSSEMIAWKDLLLLLEGQEVHLPSPKNHYATDISITDDTPIVCTSKSRITYVGRFNSTDEVENEMMAARWKIFEFFHQIPETEQKDVAPCAKCFSDMTLMGEL